MPLAALKLLLALLSIVLKRLTADRIPSLVLVVAALPTEKLFTNIKTPTPYIAVMPKKVGQSFRSIVNVWCNRLDVEDIFFLGGKGKFRRHVRGLYQRLFGKSKRLPDVVW